jgi:hypothetical protein
MIGIGTPSSQRRIPRPIVTSMLSTVATNNSNESETVVAPAKPAAWLVSVIHWPAQIERCPKQRLIRVDGYKLNVDKDRIVFVACPDVHAVMIMMLSYHKYTRGCGPHLM